MRISARIENSFGDHRATVGINDDRRTIDIPAKASGFGSSASGGELLFLALATCYCNDIYREAAQRGIEVERVEVDVDGDFGGPGDPGTNISYSARVTAKASAAEIEELMRHTDTVAEIQNTLRIPTPVTLAQIEAIPVETT